MRPTSLITVSSHIHMHGLWALGLHIASFRNPRAWWFSWYFESAFLNCECISIRKLRVIRSKFQCSSSTSLHTDAIKTTALRAAPKLGDIFNEWKRLWHQLGDWNKNKDENKCNTKSSIQSYKRVLTMETTTATRQRWIPRDWNIDAVRINLDMARR